MARYFGPARVRHTDPFAQRLCMQYASVSRLVMSGGDLSKMQASMGYKDIRLTRWRMHLSSDHKQRTVRVLEFFAEKSPQFFPLGEREGDSDTA